MYEVFDPEKHGDLIYPLNTESFAYLMGNKLSDREGTIYVVDGRLVVQEAEPKEYGLFLNNYTLHPLLLLTPMQIESCVESVYSLIRDKGGVFTTDFFQSFDTYEREIGKGCMYLDLPLISLEGLSTPADYLATLNKRKRYKMRKVVEQYVGASFSITARLKEEEIEWLKENTQARWGKEAAFAYNQWVFQDACRYTTPIQYAILKGKEGEILAISGIYLTLVGWVFQCFQSNTHLSLPGIGTYSLYVWVGWLLWQKLDNTSIFDVGTYAFGGDEFEAYEVYKHNACNATHSFPCMLVTDQAHANFIDYTPPYYIGDKKRWVFAEDKT